LAAKDTHKGRETKVEFSICVRLVVWQSQEGIERKKEEIDSLTDAG
jgi:hypothetical protein